MQTDRPTKLSSYATRSTARRLVADMRDVVCKFLYLNRLTDQQNLLATDLHTDRPRKLSSYAPSRTGRRMQGFKR